MFEQLVNETATNLRLPKASVSTVLQALLSLVGDERTGGLEGFIGTLRRAGVPDAFTSGSGAPQTKKIDAGYLEAALGTSSLDTMARTSALTRSNVITVLGLLVPAVIRELSAIRRERASNRFSSMWPEFTSAAPNSADSPRPAVIPVNDRGVPGWLGWAIAALFLAL